MWTKTLGIRVELQNMEWGSTLQATTSLQYDVARRSWIGDYLDPGTFLDIMRGDDGNNRTGWRDARYDGLLRAAAAEPDPAARLKLLGRAEAHPARGRAGHPDLPLRDGRAGEALRARHLLQRARPAPARGASGSTTTGAAAARRGPPVIRYVLRGGCCSSSPRCG